MAAAENMSPEQRQDMVRSMVDGLAARLEQQPDDIEGWRMLGRSWAVLGDPAKSAEAFAQAARRLPDDVAAQLREHAARAFEAVGCEGLARVDFFVMPDNSLIVNEINTMPGFTPTSMYPRMWAASGLDYPALVDRLIQLALNRDTGLR